jgi:hypothetical protein
MQEIVANDGVAAAVEKIGTDASPSEVRDAMQQSVKENVAAEATSDGGSPDSTELKYTFTCFCTCKCTLTC